MRDRSLRVVIVAEESAGVQTLNALVGLQPAPEIVGVLTSTDSARERRSLVYEAARRLEVETGSARLVRSGAFAKRLQDEAIDILINVHSLFVAHPEVVAAPRIGSFNLHPGPLPEYAGLNAPSWAIYNGEARHGVTLHWMDKDIDAGPVVWLDWFGLSDADTGLSVAGQCVRRGVPLVVKLVQTAAQDPTSIPRIPQDRARRRYFGAGPPSGGSLDWSWPAGEISRFVRAADYAPFPSPWGHPQAVLEGRPVGIVKVASTGLPAEDPPGTVREITTTGAVVATGDELVVVNRIWLDGRYAKPMELMSH